MNHIGRILDASTGNPLPGVVVDIGGYKNTSDWQGYWLVRAPKTLGGTAQVQMSKDGYHTRHYELKDIKQMQIRIFKLQPLEKQ